jgi:hypothetical protein
VNIESALPKVAEICGCVNFIPKVPEFQIRLAKFLAVKLVGDKTLTACGGKPFTPEARLEWIIAVIVEDICRWPEGGFQEVRACYCRFFPPADGQESAVVSEFAECIHPPAPIPVPPKELPDNADPELAAIAAMIASGADKMKGKK